MAPFEDTRHMARALQLARRGLYSTAPNPRVGCVVVADGQVVGEGWHQRAGEPHAEVHALRQAGARARGATVYVTLEPCSHQGRTPPCADALVNAGVARVVVAMTDPNPQVAGQGLARLRAAGIEATAGVLEAEAEALNPGFYKRMRQGLPLVRLKLAMSLDGRTAMASGESQWITGAAARSDVQRLRARSGAVVTGIGTVIADDPALNVRLRDMGPLGDNAAPVVQPLRVVLDSALRIQPEARLFQNEGACLVVTTGMGQSVQPGTVAALLERGVDVVSLADTPPLALAPVLRLLAERQINDVLVEAGPTLAGAFIEQGLVDELWLYQAPTLLGSLARPLVNLELTRMQEQRRLRVLDRRQIGDDLRWILGCGD